MSTYMAEALMDSLIAFARAGAKGPTEIALPTRDYLWLAGDLNIDDPSAPRRIAYDRKTPPAFAGPVGQEETFELKEVRVPSSFVFQGPCGPVTIREVVAYG